MTVRSCRRNMSHKIKDIIETTLPALFYVIWCGNHRIIERGANWPVGGRILIAAVQQISLIHHFITELHVIFGGAFHSGYKYRLQYGCLFCGNSVTEKGVVLCELFRAVCCSP